MAIADKYLIKKIERLVYLITNKSSGNTDEEKEINELAVLVDYGMKQYKQRQSDKKHLAKLTNNGNDVFT